MSPGIKFLTVGLLATLLASILYLRSLTQRLVQIPHLPTSRARVQLREAVLEAAPSQLETVSLFFPQPTSGRLLREDRTLSLAAAEHDRAKQILVALKEGSRTGLDPFIANDAEIRAVFVAADGTAYVDFSHALRAGVAPGIVAETLTIYSLVNTLTANIPSIQKVKILLEGQEAETLRGHVDLMCAYPPDPSWAEPTWGD